MSICLCLSFSFLIAPILMDSFIHSMIHSISHSSLANARWARVNGGGSEKIWYVDMFSFNFFIGRYVVRHRLLPVLYAINSISIQHHASKPTYFYNQSNDNNTDYNSSFALVDSIKIGHSHNGQSSFTCCSSSIPHDDGNGKTILPIEWCMLSTNNIHSIHYHRNTSPTPSIICNI